MTTWRLTVRHASRVDREQFATLDEAVAALERGAERVRAGGGLSEVSMLRTFEPRQRVAARLELSGSGLRRAEAGIDVMGDGALVPFRGAIVKKRLKPERGRSAYDAVREALLR